MGLPKIEHPTFVLNLPSTQQQITYRPFLVKEEKILLTAQSAGDVTDMLRAIKQVIQNCILSPTMDVDTFTTFDLEFFFIRLRARSVNNIVKLSYRDNEDEQVYDVEVDLDDVKVTYADGVSDVIQVDDSIGIKLKYPRVDITDKVGDVETMTDFTFELIKNCIDCVYTDDEVFKASDYTAEELEEFIYSLNVATFEKIQAFFNNIPKVEHTVTYTNSLGNERRIMLRNLQDFFSLG